ncbi:MAG: hypothetical protein HFJ50_09565 [Clostridia bacterium]|nr:hypothetical protein [Clostridia bacterium]
MDLKYCVIDNKYFNVKDVLKSEFKVSGRLFLKLRNNNHIFLNRKNINWK